MQLNLTVAVNLGRAVTQNARSAGPLGVSHDVIGRVVRISSGARETNARALEKLYLASSSAENHHLLALVSFVLLRNTKIF